MAFTVEYLTDVDRLDISFGKLNRMFAELASSKNANLSEATDVVTLTDNSGGTSGGNTIAVIGAGTTDTSAAKLTDTQNAIATLAAKQDAILAALKAAGLMASS